MGSFGPYYRYTSETQTEEDAEEQIKSQELWGKPSKNTYQSGIARVKAYTGERRGEQGVVFTTDVQPDAASPPGKVFWTGPREGVRVEGDYAKIKLLTIRRYPQ